MVWGSLYPWQPHAAPADITWDLLLDRATAHITRHGAEDILLNIALFLPIGFLGFESLPGRLGAWRAAVAGVFAGVACSITIEYLQLYFSRDASLLDVAANSLGTVLGVATAAALHHYAPGTAVKRADAAGLLVLWLGGQLYPPLPAHGGLHIVAFMRPWAEEAATAVLAMSEMVTLGVIATALTTRERSRAWLLLGASAAVAMRFFSDGRALSKAEFLGVITGLLMASVVRRPLPAAVCLTIGLAFAGLAPFNFLPVAGNFSWVPFNATLVSPWSGGLPILLAKIFRYAGLVWLLREAGWRWRTAAMLAASLLALIEFAQMWLPLRSAEVTDPLLALISAYVLWEISKVKKMAPVVR